MAKTEFGQELSSQAANDVYLLKTEDDTITGILSLENGVDINKHLGDTQEHIYTVGQIMGIIGENDPNAKIYSSTNYISNGDDRKVVVEKLDTQVKLNADNIAINVIAIAANAANIQINADDIADILAAIGVDAVTSPLATGIASLDNDGKIPLAQLPNSLLQYLGTWDASTNTPTLADGTGVENTWYRVNVAGTIDLGAGSETYAVGDKVVHNGASWDKWDTNDEVTSVFSRTGDVVAQTGDYTPTQIGLGNVTDDAQLKRAAGDLNTFAEKTTPVDADIVIIEDSEDSFNKKKVLLENIGIGGGSGAGGINHLLDQAEDAGLWTSDVNFTIANNLSNPLRGDQDLLISKAAVDASGEVVSVPFTIDDADKGKLLPLTFDYKSAGAYQDFEYEIEIYDVSSAIVIDNTNPAIIAQDSFTNKHLTYWQANFASTSYELRVKCITTETTASSMQVKTLQTGPVDCKAGGPFISDWIDFTPTGTWSGPVTYTGKYRRVGSQAEIQYSLVASGAPTGSFLYFDMPTGLTVDSSSVVFSGNGSTYVTGSGEVLNAGLTTYPVSSRLELASNQFRPLIEDTGAAHTRFTNVTPTIPFSFNTGDSVQITASIPIQGWETGIKPAEVVSGRLHAFSAIANALQSVPDQTFVKLTNWASPTFDDSGAWDSVNNKYIAPESGYYIVNGAVRVGPDPDNDIRRLIIAFYVNGLNASSNISQGFGASGILGTGQTDGTRLLKLEKGDELEIYVWQDNTNDTTLNTTNTADQFIDIYKVNNLSAQIQPTETVAAKYKDTSGQSLTGTGSVISYPTKIHDTHNMMNGSFDTFIIPVSGLYLVSGSIGTAGGTPFAADANIQLRAAKNGIDITRSFTRTRASSTSYMVETLAQEYFTAGDTLQLYYYGSVNTNADTTDFRNYTAITKIGN